MIASEILTAAFREGNLIPLATDPTTGQQTEALARLNAFVRALMGQELGSRLNDWPVPSGQRATTGFHTTIHAPFPGSVEGFGQPGIGHPIDTGQWTTPPANSRLIVKLTTAATVYFPEQPSAGARMRAVDVGATADLTVHGNGRLVEGAASVVLTPPFSEPRDWFYRDDLANWVAFADMALATASALPPEFDEFLIAALTVRLSPTYGLEPRAGTTEAFARGFKKIKAHYQQAAASVSNAGDVPRTDTTFGGGGGGLGF